MDEKNSELQSPQIAVLRSWQQRTGYADFEARFLDNILGRARYFGQYTTPNTPKALFWTITSA